MDRLHGRYLHHGVAQTRAWIASRKRMAPAGLWRSLDPGEPLDRARLSIALGDVVVDRLLEGRDASLRAALDLALSEVGKNALDTRPVEPRRIRWREVHREARVLQVQEPCASTSCRRPGAGRAQRRPSRHNSFARCWRWHLPISSPVVTSSAANNNVVPGRSYWQVRRSGWPGRIGSCALIGAWICDFSSTDDTIAVRRRRNVEAHDLSHLLDEVRVVGQAEHVGAVRLKPEDTVDSLRPVCLPWTRDSSASRQPASLRASRRLPPRPSCR